MREERGGETEGGEGGEESRGEGREGRGGEGKGGRGGERRGGPAVAQCQVGSGILHNNAVWMVTLQTVVCTVTALYSGRATGEVILVNSIFLEELTM